MRREENAGVGVFATFGGKLVTTVPLGRMGIPDEAAKVASFLASDETSYVIGIELFVDGDQAKCSFRE